jgi:hypothetical protein
MIILWSDIPGIVLQDFTKFGWFVRKRSRILFSLLGFSCDCELQWAEIQTNNKSVIIGSYYRPPNSNLDAFNNLKSSIANVSEHSKDKPIILAGDFNLPPID